MILLIIRHGESEADILHVHEGRADFELTERGHGQAAAMARYVAGQYSLTRIYASSLMTGDVSNVIKLRKMCHPERSKESTYPPPLQKEGR